MPDQTIICPHCSQSIPLNQALSEQIKHELEHQFEAEHRVKLELLEKQTRTVEESKKQLADQKSSLDETLKLRLEAEKQKLWQLAQEKAKENSSIEIKDYQEQLKENSRKLEEAQKNELELRKQSRELEEQKKNLDLELQRRLDSERQKLIEETKKKEAEEFRMKLLEKDKQVEIMQKTIEDLRRQSQQGSMQIQGEVQEDELKQLLSTTFFTDTVSDVPTGIKGGDVIQIVNNSLGQKAGVILWESKNTKAWSNDWVTKLKQDQGAAGADVCLLVTRVLPDDVQGFGVRNGVWILEYQYIIPLVTTLRFHLLELSKLKQSVVGRDQKMEYLYQYISGNQFKNRVESIVLAFSTMKSELEAERRAMERIWHKRNQQIERVITNTAGLYGDMQGILGASLPSIQSLDLPESELQIEDSSKTETVEEASLF